MASEQSAGRRQAFIWQKAKQNRLDPVGRKVLWSRHAITKLVVEGLSRQGVEQALISCEVIETYPAHTRPLPDCLVLGWLAEGQPIHAVIAIDETNDRIFVITVYRPDPRRWEDDYRTRKE
ncbi:MAG: DUF4258 domain-containing protein [Anaerolineae bacterium]|nr:DUF4258 domain-containing protein [Anaerolineae bacterium]